MAPKVDKSKAAQKEKIAVDKTFGLKNKNKSKVVQKYIKSIVANSKGESKKADQAERKEQADKAAAAQKNALMNSLFNLSTDKKGRAFDPVAKKKAKQEEEEAAAAGKKLKEEQRKAVIEGLANSIRLTNSGKGLHMSELGGHPIVKALKESYPEVFKTLQILLFIKANPKIFWVDDEESSNPTIRMTEDVDGEEAPDERPIEEIIEERRAALDPSKLTPVTPETFKAWKERKEAERQKQEEEARDAAVKKASGNNKAVVGLSGRDLFTFDASLFVDDAEAASGDEYDVREEVLEDKEEAEKGDDDDEDDEEDEEEEDDEAEEKEDGGARGSSEAPGEAGAEEVTINKELFLEDGEDLDDLDDLDDDDDDGGGGKEKD